MKRILSPLVTPFNHFLLSHKEKLSCRDEINFKQLQTQNQKLWWYLEHT